MASIWLEPILHESNSYHSDPIRLRRPLLITEIRIAKPQFPLHQVEFSAKDLRTPSDELVTLERVERVEPTGNDFPIKLREPILTNFLAVKGEYKSLNLCLEASEVSLNNNKLTIKLVKPIQIQADIELLHISPLEYHGLFQYWMDFEDSSITSIRYSFGDFASPSPAVFTLWKSPQESVNATVNEIEGLLQGISSGTGYLGNLEKLGGLIENVINFYHAGYDSANSGLRKLADSKLPLSLVKIAISALEGNLHGLMEAKAALIVINHLLELPRLAQNFLESSGLSHLLLLITHPSASSQLVSKILNSFHALISVPSNVKYFFEYDSTLRLDAKLIQIHFTFPKTKRKDDNKKVKVEEEGVYKTGYQILLGLLNEKKSIKVTNCIKGLLNKCSFYYSLQKLTLVIRSGENPLSMIETIRRNLKLQMLRSSSHAFTSVKHDLLTFLLLDSGTTLQNLQGTSQLMSQQILTNSLADWLTYTNFLPNLLSFFVSQTTTLDDYRIAFINITDILLMLIRSSGGFGYLALNAEVLMGFIHAYQGLAVPINSEDPEFNIIEEEYLLSTVTVEKMPSYARQMVVIISSLLKISEQLAAIKNGEVLTGMNSLYALVNSDDAGSITTAVLYCVVRHNPEILLWIVEQVDLALDADNLKSFYVLELLKTILQEDRSGEVMLLIGQDLYKTLDNSGCIYAELRDSIDILLDLLKPISKLKNGDPDDLISDISTIAKVKKDKIEAKAAFFVIGESTYPDLDLSSFGDLNTKGSAILQLLPSLRLINLILSVKKWLSIQLIKQNFLPILTNIVSKTTQILHTLYTKPNTKEVFNIINISQVKNEHFELMIPCINIFNIILEQLLGTELLMYNNSPLLESLLHLASLCEIESSYPGEFVKAKISRMIKTVFILWAQLPNFCDIYLPIIFEHAFQYPFKKSAILTIIGSIFEYYISSKDPSFYHKCAEWAAKDYSMPLFGPELIYYYIIQASNIEGEHKIMNSFQMSESKIKESSASKYEVRNSWNYKKYLGLFIDQQGSIIDKSFRILFSTNNYEVHISFIRILRCILACNNLQAGKNIIDHLKRKIRDKNSFNGKAIYVLHAISDIPCAKGLCLHEDMPDLLISFLHKNEFTKITLRIFENFFDASITSCDDEKKSGQNTGNGIQSKIELYTYTEDMPTISQIQHFLLEIREFLMFDVPGIEDAAMEDDEDQLYGEFTKAKQTVANISWEITLGVLNTLKVLSSNPVGKSLIVCSHYPPKESPGPLDFVGLAKRISIGLNQEEYQECSLVLLAVFLDILKNTGTNVLTPESLANLTSQLKHLSSTSGEIEKPAKSTSSSSSPSQKANTFLKTLASLTSIQPIPSIDLPIPRDINIKFPAKTPDFNKIKDFSKILKKNHSNQLILSKRVGEKIQVKPIQFLTDLLPPPYPPQFKYKVDIKVSDWSSFNEAHQELTTEKVLEKQKIFEEKIKKSLPPNGYVPSNQNEIMMPKAPIQPMMPIQQTIQQTMNTQFTRNIAAPQNFLNDSERKAYNELANLIQKKDRSQDPRLQLRIDQILGDYPSFANYLKN
ncbi:hypothetical protein SteCoe_10204 [Stentor coeruleus]|uniref:Uncharacterized protein n=1 Tax=Stentor coeruleus TaxID=5963 RepID=A0A1R2CG18_9CILI|nr:hypothetical protein SteCoe_10204 [Stentor coeruleus]